MIIYKATCKITGKVYIGQTRKQMEVRRYEHIRDAFTLNVSTTFANALRKYGKENFEWEVIDNAVTQEELDEKEIYWISEYNSTVEGYNMLPGGSYNPMDNVLIYNKHLTKVQSIEFRKKHSILMKEVVSKNGFSEDHRQKISQKLKGNKHFLGKSHSPEWGVQRSQMLSGEKHPMYGKKHSEEVKKRISEVARNQKMGAKTIIQFDLEGNKLNTFKSLASAERWIRENTQYVRATEQTIRKYARLNRPTYGYLWKYESSN